MKKILVLMAMVATTAHAGLLDAAATQGWPTKQTKRYKLDVYGYDARAYEFETDNGMKCIMVFPGGSAQGWQMECLPNK
jgi:hypothetical protein